MCSDRMQSLIGELAAAGEGEDVSIGELLKASGDRSFGPFLLVPAIIALAPTGAIPGMSIITGCMIALVAIQMVFGFDRPWLPVWLTEKRFARDRVSELVEKARGAAERVDQKLSRRFMVLTEAPAKRFVGVVCVLMGLSMFPLALLPFAVALPGAAVGLIGLGLFSRDGLILAIGVVLGLGAMVLVAYLFIN